MAQVEESKDLVALVLTSHLFILTGPLKTNMIPLFLMKYFKVSDSELSQNLGASLQYLSSRTYQENKSSSIYVSLPFQYGFSPQHMLFPLFLRTLLPNFN